MFRTNFLTSDQAVELAYQYGTPLYVYSQSRLIEQAQKVLAIPAPFGLTVRYAMKANPHPEILKTLKDQGIKIDASSAYEAERALRAGFKGEHILLTSQQLAHNLEDVSKQGVQFNATSLHQLECYGRVSPGTNVSVRINPGVGSGHSKKVTTGGQTSSFGVWHEYIPKIHDIAHTYNLTVVRMHTHIGAGTDPKVWQAAARTSLELIRQFPEATVINLGGGFKVGRMDDEQSTDMVATGQLVTKELKRFHEQTGRKLHLELEPGTFLVANAGILLAEVMDIVDTGKDGYTFMKLNTGMNDILRPGLYGAQQPIAVLGEIDETQEYVVVGHNCESGDLLTPEPGEPEAVSARALKKAKIGDLVLIGGAGAYCAAMAAHGYNSFPSAKEVMLTD